MHRNEARRWQRHVQVAAVSCVVLAAGLAISTGAFPTVSSQLLGVVMVLAVLASLLFLHNVLQVVVRASLVSVRRWRQRVDRGLPTAAAFCHLAATLVVSLISAAIPIVVAVVCLTHAVRLIRR